MSLVWKYAEKRKNLHTNETEAVCNTCKNVIKCSGGSTTTLKAHLKNRHNIDVEADITDKNIVPHAKKNKIILDFVHKKSLCEIVSDLATDGISIRAITRNRFINQSILKEGYQLPKNETRVMKLIHDDYFDKKKKMIEEIKSKIEKGVKFSITLDEYTTIRRRRYFGINLHDGGDVKTFKTGIIRIYGSCNAESMFLIIEKHLFEFGIVVQKDIVGSTQDGAAINKKFMQIMGVIGQFCLNHAIHLAVSDTLYKKCKKNDLELDVDEDEADEVDLYEDVDFEVIKYESMDEIDFHDVLKNARIVINYIRDSTVRNHIFQSKVKAEFGNEIELVLDVKHRWNSIPCMISPLLKTKKCLFETFNELNANTIINKLDFDSLAGLRNSIEPIKLAVEALSQEKANLLTAETVVDFMLRKLSSKNSTINVELHENLKSRIGERWNSDVMNLLNCLKDPSNVPSKNTLHFAGKLAERLFGMKNNEPNFNIIQENLPDLSLSLEDELFFLLQKNNSTLPLSTVADEFKWLKQEFILFKNTGKRTDNLQKIFNALLTIKPTSTDVERVFSICTHFCTKIRSRLSDVSLNSLVFLKFYYKKT